MSAERPNILVIMSDQHSKHALGCYGNNIVRTPNLDRLAAGGMKFTDAYCPAPLCVPSRMSFMTSRTPTRNRVWDNLHILSSGIPTWAHVLGAAGYETSLIGRMHFVGSDQRHGFMNRPVGETCARHPGTAVAGGPMWTKFPASTTGQNRKAVEIAGKGRTFQQWFDEERTKAALDYLRSQASSESDKPFAAVLGYVLPHCPFIAPKDLFDYYYPIVDIPTPESTQPDDIAKFRETRGLSDPVPEERIRVARAAYFGMVEHMDGLIGRVLDCLEENDLAKNTLVVYCSDHGEMAGEHGCWWKSNYYEGSVGVPLIFRLPDRVQADSTSQAVCNLMDLGATFADVAGGRFEPAPDGRSLWNTLRGDHPGDWRNETFSELVDAKNEWAPSRMIRRDEWKLWLTVQGDNPKPVLFNLRDDPDELRDLSEDPARAKVKNQLLDKLFTEWDPESAKTMTRENNKAYWTISQWGKTHNPAHPDSITLPPADYESNVELL